MGETVKLIAQMDKYTRVELIEIYEKMKEKYAQIIETVFKDPWQATEKYRQELHDKYATAFNWENTDPADIYDNILGQAQSFYEYEELMRHNFHMSFLSTMYQVFEQQLRRYIYKELQYDSNFVDPGPYAEFGVNMGEIKEIYLLFKYNLDNDDHWETIQELQDLSNAFKHGDGTAAKRLQKKHSEVFVKTPVYRYRVMDQQLTTNSETAFDLEQIDFNKFADELIEFWTDFPVELDGEFTFKD